VNSLRKDFPRGEVKGDLEMGDGKIILKINVDYV
jgi:hypothetical protein